MTQLHSIATRNEMPTRNRILVLGNVPHEEERLREADLVRLGDAGAVADALHDGGFATVIAEASKLIPLLDEARRNALLVSNTERGFAMTDTTGRVEWANEILKSWCSRDPAGQNLRAALDMPMVATDHDDPLGQVLSGKAVTVGFHRPVEKPEYLDVRLHPVFAPDGTVDRILVLCRDVSMEMEQQLKFEALHQAGRDLVELEAETLAEVSIPERIESLKYNLRKIIDDLLHYDIIELRLYDKPTNRLVPLLEEGMTPEAANRQLEALPEHNGVTGWVAYHRRSYLCKDASVDLHYLQGATGARSSLTVPIISGGELVGTFNVESPQLDAFSEDDLRFTELFSKEIATALHTLDLLSAQQYCTKSQSVELVSREIALPMDDVLASAAVLLKKLGDRDDSIVDHLKRIVGKAREIKENVRKVGDEAEASKPGTFKPLAGKRVLVLEQEARLRKEAHKILEHLGASAETVGTAAEALALLAHIDYDAVLMEVRPIDLGGYDTFKLIRETRPNLKIAMTNGFGYDANHSIVKARSEGLKSVLFKPFKPDQVVKAILDPA